MLQGLESLSVSLDLVLFTDPSNPLCFADAILLGADHDRRSVGIVRTKIATIIALQPLKPNPNVGLDVFNQVSQVNRAVGVGQSGSNEDATLSHAWFFGCVVLWMRRLF